MDLSTILSVAAICGSLTSTAFLAGIYLERSRWNDLIRAGVIPSPDHTPPTESSTKERLK